MWRRVKIQLKNYCDDSTLHGVRYLSEGNRPIFEKLLWLTVILCSGTIAIVIIFSSWTKFQTDPTITGVDVNFHNKTLLFPSTFVCPSDPIDYKKFHSVLANELHINTNSDGSSGLYKFFQSLPTLNYDRLNTTFSIPSRFEYRGYKSLQTIILSYVYSCQQFFAACSIKGRTINCCQHFFPILTEQGFCYVFNNHRKTGFNLTYIFESDTSWNLEILIQNITIPSAIYFTESNAWLQHGVVPQFIWQHGFTSTLLLDIQEFYNADNIRELSLKQRACIFSDQVEYMPEKNAHRYEHSECLIECRKQIQTQLCQCILYFYSANRTNFKWCSLRQMECIKTNIDRILAAQCNCHENCRNSEYRIYKTVDTPKIKKITKISENDVYEEEIDPDFTQIPLTVGFYSWPLVRYKREILFGWIDLLVSFGGIAGLFLGFSLLSAIEFIYYFTMRFIFTYMRRRQLQICSQHRFEFIH